MPALIQRIALTLLLACTVTVGMALDELQQRQLTMDDGMPSNAVRNILQDHRGFIWMGTEGGLCRYDGRVITTHLLPEKANQHVRALTLRGDKELLVAFGNEVYSFSIVTEQFTELPLQIEKAVNNLAEDRDGRLWISTEGQGIVAYDYEESEPKEYAMTDCGGNAEYVYVDQDNQIWALSGKGSCGIWRLNKNLDIFERARLDNSDEGPADPTCMLQTNDGRQWVATWEHGLWQIADDGTHIEPMPMPDNGHILHIHSITELSARQLLMNCDDGLWLFDTARREFSLSMPLRFVSTTLRDTEGGLWIGTRYGGASYVSPISTRFDATPGGLITCFAEDWQGRIWVAGDEGGLSCYQNGQRLANFTGKQQIAQLNVHALCADGSNIWLATYASGLYVLNTLTGQLRHFPQQAVGTSYAILRDRQERIWVATTEGLNLYDRKADCFNRVVHLGAIPLDLDQDMKGRIWVATQGGGLFRYDPDGQLRSYRSDDKQQESLPDNIVNCTLIDQQGHIWVGTQGGLCQYDEQKDCFSRVPLDVPRQAISSIAEDQGVLWLSGDCGILKYHPQEGLQRFTRHDGLVSEQFQPNSVLKASDGRIYFGTIQGFNSFFPHQIKVNRLLPPVYITHLEIGNTPIPVGNWHLPESLTDIEQLDLWYNDEVFSLSFASLSYCSPEKNMYAYMLEGFDKKWNYVLNGQKATYTNLPAGKYTFRVKATNNDGIWSNDEATLKIVIHPPYWWSTYAKIAYVLLFILLVWGIIRLRLMLAERRHRHEMQALREQQEEEVRQQRMQFFTTIAHEIRTPVSLIIGPLETLKQQFAGTQAGSSQLDIIDRNAHRLLTLVNQLLDFRKVSEQPDVSFSIQNIRQLISRVADDFSPAFKNAGREFVITLPNERFTAAVDPEAITKIVSNLLSNANKYTRNRITLASHPLPDEQHFVIEVGDNGRGIAREDQARVFDEFFQTHDRKPGTGIGLSIVKHLVEAHHGKAEVESEKGRGTLFRITLPISQNVVNESTPAPKPAPTAAQPNKPSILVVDDNDDMLTFLVTTLMDDYDVTPAHDGNEALELIKESLVSIDGQQPTSTFQMVISDWMMEGMEGPELCNRLRQNPATNRMPFILLTAKTDSASKVEAMEKGVDAFIEKPFAVKYLMACMSNLFRSRKNT